MDGCPIYGFNRCGYGVKAAYYRSQRKVMNTALDNALKAINASIGDNPDEQTALIAAKCRGLMRGYDARWRDAGWETISVEEQFELPVINPESERSSRSFRQGGKIDGMIRFAESGRKYLLEHKSTSQDISDPASPYWGVLAIDSQVSHYVLGKWQGGTKLDGTVYDVMRKPGIRPKKISSTDQMEMIKHGTYCGFEIPKSLRLHKEESLDHYELRLYRETLDEPNKYFQRRTIHRLDSELLEYAQEMWEVSQSILDARRKDAHYRNSNACIQYNSPCEYLSLCRGEDSPESDRWVKQQSVHDELIVEDGRDLLTNSRLKCFQTCRRKHLYRYEMGLRRRQDEEREALVFGSLWHEALEQWWLFFKKGSENGNASSLTEGDGAADGLESVCQD